MRLAEPIASQEPMEWGRRPAWRRQGLLTGQPLRRTLARNAGATPGEAPLRNARQPCRKAVPLLGHVDLRVYASLFRGSRCTECHVGPGTEWPWSVAPVERIGAVLTPLPLPQSHAQCTHDAGGMTGSDLSWESSRLCRRTTHVLHARRAAAELHANSRKLWPRASLRNFQGRPPNSAEAGQQFDKFGPNRNGLGQRGPTSVRSM